MLSAMLIPLTLMAAGLPLLPEPRELKLGQGQLTLDRVSISFAERLSPEDRFVQDALTQVLAEAQVKLVAGKAPTVIRLHRKAAESAEESYSLLVDERGIHIEAPAARGLFYGVQTLRQLLVKSNGKVSVPFVRVDDAPRMPLRGFMLDLSHGPFPKFEELKRQIDFLARWKANQFYLYSETNIELDGFPLLSPRARLTKAQVRELIAYARARFIDVVPCVELYGHLHDLVRVEHYAQLGEMTHGGEVNPIDPKVHALIENWVNQFADLFPSQWFHVGFDETYELGKAPGRKLSNERRGEVYLGFFERVSKMVAARGKRVMVWSDIILQHPEVISKLPAGTVAVPWRYRDEKSYDAFVEPLAKAGVQFLVGTGVWNYYDATPDFDHTIRNVNGFLESARKFKGLGIIHTEWTDDGQVILRAGDPGVAFGPVAAWSNSVVDRGVFYERYAQLEYSRQPETLSRLLAVLSESQSVLEETLGSRVIQEVWQDPLDAKRVENARKKMEAIRGSRLKAEEAQVLAMSMLRAEPENALADALLYCARLLDYIALRQIYAVEIDGFRKVLAAEPTRANHRLLLGIETSDHTHSRLFDLMDEAGELRKHLEALWLRDYTPFRLQTALGRWQGEFDRWRVLQEKFTQSYRDYRNGDTVP